MKRTVFLMAVLVGLTACKRKEPFVLPPTLYLSAYPNPMLENLSVHIRNDENESGMIRIFDPTNKIVFEKSLELGEDGFNVNLAQYPDGIYKVVLSTPKYNYSQQIIKIK